MRRRWGLRSRLAVAVVGVALASVSLATLAGGVALERGLQRGGREDLELSADHAAAVAGELYLRDGGWEPSTVDKLERLEAVQGHTVVVHDATGTPLPGTTPHQAPERALAPVILGGERVGDISLAHLAGGYLRLGDEPGASGLAAELARSIGADELRVALVAGLLALLVALALSRPLRRTLARVAQLEREDEERRAAVAELAHELRTPMTGLRARIEGARDRVLRTTPDLLAAMHADVIRLGRLMDDVAELATPPRARMPLRWDLVELGALARSRSQAFAACFAQTGIELAVDVRPAGVYGDRERLGQVLDNLLSNALRYTDPGGRVTLGVHPEREHAVVEVRDTGIGIAPDDLGRVFERAWRGRASRARAADGAGLGLALVHELVAAHGGVVEVDSEPGSGSRFRVLLPLEVRLTRPPTRLRPGLREGASNAGARRGVGGRG